MRLRSAPARYGTSPSASTRHTGWLLDHKRVVEIEQQRTLHAPILTGWLPLVDAGQREPQPPVRSDVVDWRAWHEDYVDPDSVLGRRLVLVQAQVHAALDRARPRVTLARWHRDRPVIARSGLRELPTFPPISSRASSSMGSRRSLSRRRPPGARHARQARSTPPRSAT